MMSHMLKGIRKTGIKYEVVVREAPIVLHEDEDEEYLTQAVLRLNGNILGLVIGILAGLIIFVATNWLVLKGGQVVGPHLSLLGQFFIGYSVTFVGSLIGMIYGFITGYLAGLLIGWVYNGVMVLKSRLS
jgi:hypothetical protein